MDPGADACPMDEEQSEHAQRVRELWADRAPLLRLQHELRGGIIWKRARGHEYLYRYRQDTLTGSKVFEGRGRRSPETEAEHAEYLRRRDRVQEHLTRTDSTVETAGRIARAFRLARFPATPAQVVHSLWLEGLLDDRCRMMGATALFGYELEA
ncbi:hypothetical protein WDZ92_31955, partial [Nostoc sp. NIES-2111]